MIGTYIERTLEPLLKQASKDFPAVVLSGPRQSGKTTLLRHLFGDRYRYISLEPPDVRAAALVDPRSFLELNSPPVILDEIQYAPGLLPFIKERIDADRQNKGMYLLTGSQNLQFMDIAGESLAGRAAILNLMPLTMREAWGRPHSRFPWDSARATSPVTELSFGGLWEYVVRGGYPELASDPDRDVLLWQGSYMQTYLERDVRSLRQVGDLMQFRAFLQILAARNGQLLNLSDVARDLGIAVNTARTWLSVLEATFVVIVLRPYHANIGKRLVKTPKVYFSDTGMLCWLLGISNPDHARLGPSAGGIMESLVVSEVYKALLHMGMPPRIHFWRTSAGSEVDLVVEFAGKLVPLEIKLSATPRPEMAASIRTFQHDLGDMALPGYVIHPGDVILPLGGGVTALPFSAL
ncbi:MAG: ATP-binding protein [Candidatus Fermentibacteraceae bacterium]